jgi:hypothetical protein
MARGERAGGWVVELTYAAEYAADNRLGSLMIEMVEGSARGSGEEGGYAAGFRECRMENGMWESWGR